MGTQFPAVQVANLSKSFSLPRERKRGEGRFPRVGLRRRRVLKHALKDVSLEIGSGTMTGVIGLNGSGKSTLIRILATLTLPDAGEARVFGVDVVQNPMAVRRCINRVSVEAAFFKEMSPWENLSYAGRLYGSGGPSSRQAVEAALRRLGFSRGALNRPMKHLSRGQQQKVAIARSFLSTPNMLLMDEPTTGLDPRSKREVQEFVGAIRSETGATVILSTHDLSEADQLCERVLLLDRGGVLADGSPSELKRRYGNGAPDVSLEDVFLSLSGRSFEEDSAEPDEEDDELDSETHDSKETVT